MPRHWIGLLMVTVSWGTIAMIQTNKTDEQIIRDMVTESVRRLNGGDTSVIREFWAEDADYVGVGGQMVHGRDGLEALMSQMLKASDKRPVQAATIEGVRFFTPDVAIVDGQWTMTGARDASGNALAPIKGRGVEIVRKSNNGWRFVATREMVIWNGR
jgi:uncharacterized protein (TIGR02246 family)